MGLEEKIAGRVNDLLSCEEKWLMLCVLRRTRIITITVGILNLTIQAMRNEFESFLLGQTAAPIHRLGFGFKMLRDSFGIRSHSIPTTPLLIVNNMYLFPHIHYC